MKLTELLKHSCNLVVNFDREIEGLTIDSRLVKPGYLFIAYQGVRYDARDYINDAIAKGAMAVLVEGDKPIVSWAKDIPLIAVPKLKKYISQLGAYFYHNPVNSLRMIGITGTNGKTSCSHFLAAALTQLGISSGVQGTLGNGLWGSLKKAGLSALTTPDAIVLHQTFAELLTMGAQAVVMEVSSHSLEQGRVAGIEFEVGIFTNLTQDHLDYHGDMQKYGQAKRKLFDHVGHAVINTDDAFGQQLIHDLADKKLLTYSTENNQADVYADSIQLTLNGINATVHSPWGKGEIIVPLVGKFNLSNILAVIATLGLMNIPFQKVLQVVATLKPVSGRMEILGGGEQPLVVVDYSHTPDSLEKALTALRAHCEGKLYCLFGCGGDRDRGKRPLMAKIAEQLADIVMVTDDNPRTEDVTQIVADIMQGFSASLKVKVEHNRLAAINEVVNLAKAGDCILVAGRGGEIYQEIGNEKIPFDDAEVVKRCLSS